MKLIDADTLHSLSARAQQAPRRRANHNLHPSLDDAVQRMCNAVEPGSYVRPHCHPEANKWEFFAVLTGAAVVLTFDAQGKVTERAELHAGGPVYAVEIPPGTWHTLAALESGTVLLEVKQGPYAPLTDKDFASWAPREGEAAAVGLEAWFRSARAGEKPPM